jgi:hypothetical protein
LVDPPPSVDIVAGNVEPPAPVQTLNSAVSPAVSEAIAKAMQLNRSARYKTVAEFKKALLEQRLAITGKEQAATNERVDVITQVLKPGVSSPAVSAHLASATPAAQSRPQAQQPKIRIQGPVIIGLGALALVLVAAVVIAGVILLSGGGDENPTPTALAQALVPATEEIQPTSPIPTATLALLPTDTLPPPSVTPTPTEAPTDTPAGLPDQLTDEKGVTMILVPNGEFTRGDETETAAKECRELCSNCPCTPSSFANAEPVLKVYLDDYYLDRTEVLIFDSCLFNWSG